MKNAHFSKKNLVASTILLSICLAFMVAGCAPQENTQETSNTLTAQGGDFVWSANADCVMCHTPEGSSAENASCLAGFHTLQAQATCNTCHADTSGLESVHEGTVAGEANVKRLKKTSVESSTCLSCHDSLESLAQNTPESAYLVDANGLSVNPHAIPDTPGHKGENTCNSCHISHKDKPLEETAEANCLSCHHANIFACGTCH